jgi:hypothetical protein
METWATFSIIDHRKPIYRQALALFDRIVVPLPPKPIGNQTQEELDQLSAEIAYLKEAKAAEPYEWESAAFEEWRQPFPAESLAVGFNRDAFLDTRLMLSQQFCSQDVQAIPVYGGEHQFADSRKALMQVEEALTIEIMQRLPVPEYDTPLENLEARQSSRHNVGRRSERCDGCGDARFRQTHEGVRRGNGIGGIQEAGIGRVDLFYPRKRTPLGHNGRSCVFPGAARAVLEESVGDEMRSGRRGVSLPRGAAMNRQAQRRSEPEVTKASTGACQRWREFHRNDSPPLSAEAIDMENTDEARSSDPYGT